MIKLSDYIIKKLIEFGIKHVFMVTGGGAMHLNDSVGKFKEIEYVCTHHEQAAAIAAEGYFRATGKMAAVIVTTGPGGTNALTGVLGQWLDSIPAIYISGQVKFETTIKSCPKINLRQLGDQEADIINLVKPITKFSCSLIDPLKIKEIMENAFYIAKSDRPGPVWIDIPLDIQASIIDENLLGSYPKIKLQAKSENSKVLKNKVTEIINMLMVAKRPVIVGGHGIKLSRAEKLFHETIHKLKIPTLSTFNGFDLVENSNDLLIGRIGTIGTRAGNFALQNSDFYLSIGSRNNIRQVGYNWKTYARCAKKVVIDIDETELKKSTLIPDVALCTSAEDFLKEFNSQIKNIKLPSWNNWLSWCKQRRENYPIVLPEYWNDKKINPYCFINTLTNTLKSSDTVVAGNGSACVVLFQAGIVKKNQKIFWNSGCASMGYDIPAAIGACIANNKKRVICLAGDGSLQMNIQELQTIFHHNLPIKIFVLNNEGYLSIKQTQDSFFNKNYVGCNASSGISFPDIIKLAKAYGISGVSIKNHKEMLKKINLVLDTDGPIICEVIINPEQKFLPKAASEKKPNGRMVSKPLEDMFPFLSRQEFYSNMIIEPIKD